MPVTKWTQLKLVPTKGLVAWHEVDTLASGNVVPDLSGNGHDLSCVGDTIPPTAPEVQPGKINGMPALYFDGTRDPLASAEVSFTARHCFVIAAYDGEAFPEEPEGYAGLLSGLVEMSVDNTVLVGKPSSTVWFPFDPGRKYFLNGLNYPRLNWVASFGTIAVFEATFDFGWAMDGIQIGRQLDFDDRLFKGWYVGSWIYEEILSDCDRRDLFEYFAIKYNLWRRTPTGLAVWPFIPNHVRSAESDIEHFVSEPYSGSAKSLTRGVYKVGFSLPHAMRNRREIQAARAFHQAHRPLVPFVFRDLTFNPPIDHLVQMTTSIQEQGTEVSHKRNYTVGFVEIDKIDQVSPTITIDLDEIGEGPFSSYITIAGVAADADGVESTQLYIDGLPYGPPQAGTALEFEINTTLLGDGDHSIWAQTTDTSGNVGFSNVLSLAIFNGEPDEEAPTAPVLDPVTIDSDSEITLDWRASSDNIAVTGYQTRIDGGAWVDRGNVLTYQYTGLASETEYDFEVRAYDSAGNFSPASNLESGTTAGDPPLLDGFVEFWPMDEPNGDAIGAHAGIDLTDNNTVGASGGARDFTAANDEYFQHADSPALSTGDIDYTLAGFVNLKSLAAGGVISKYSAAAQKEFLLYFTGGTCQWYVSPDGSSVSIAADGAPVINTWYFIVVEHDSVANKIRIQINNAAAVETAHATGSFDGTAPLSFGSDPTVTGPINALMKKWGYWKGRLLTPTEKTWLYNGGAGRTYAEIIAYLG